MAEPLPLHRLARPRHRYLKGRRKVEERKSCDHRSKTTRRARRQPHPIQVRWRPVGQLRERPQEDHHRPGGATHGPLRPEHPARARRALRKRPRRAKHRRPTPRPARAASRGRRERAQPAELNPRRRQRGRPGGRWRPPGASACPSGIERRTEDWLFAIVGDRELERWSSSTFVIVARARLFRSMLVDRVALRGLLPKWRRGHGEGRRASRDTAPWRRPVAGRRLPREPPG